MASRTPSPLVHPDVEDFDLLTVLSALADPVRLGIVVKLIGCPGLSCGGFYPHLTASVLTRHFRVLREAGIIHQRDSGVPHSVQPDRGQAVIHEEMRRKGALHVDLVSISQVGWAVKKVSRKDR